MDGGGGFSIIFSYKSFWGTSHFSLWHLNLWIKETWSCEFQDLFKQIMILYKILWHWWHSDYNCIVVFWCFQIIVADIFFSFLISAEYLYILLCLPSLCSNMYVLWFWRFFLFLFGVFFFQRFLKANSFFWSLSSCARYLV